MSVSGPVRFGVYAAQVDTTFAEYLELCVRAEELDFDCVFTFDHFRPNDGGAGTTCLESTALIAAIAASTRRIRCGTLVMAVPYRHPAIVAHIGAAIDHLSNGRFELGIGAGGGDGANEQYHLPFPAVGTRMKMLAEACEVIRRLWTHEVADFDGTHYRLDSARLEPKPVQERVPLIIGGSGERLLLRVVAEHADIWNTFGGDLAAYQTKRVALDAHCRDIRRDPASIRRSIVFRAVLDEDCDRAVDRFATRQPGLSLDDAPKRGWLAIGTPDQCVEALLPYRKLGVSDFVLGVRSPFDRTTLALVARCVAPAVRDH
jgi:alkanesulfonate monooxygenase SsuD/methylene tetrahydromethanopterin reductase-like flavin-dependent oxidoreductase (luciferase family)